MIPYVSDQLAMSRLPRASYALMLALLPATATLVGIVVLAQIPTLKDTLGVLLVMAGVAIHRPPAPEPAPRRSDVAAELSQTRPPSRPARAG